VTFFLAVNVTVTNNVIPLVRIVLNNIIRPMCCEFKNK